MTDITWIFDPQYKIVTENVHKTVCKCRYTGR